MNKHIRITDNDTRTLWRAFDRLSRHYRRPSPWQPASRESMAIALISLAAELHRRGWHDAFSMWAPRGCRRCCTAGLYPPPLPGDYVRPFAEVRHA